MANVEIYKSTIIFIVITLLLIGCGGGGGGGTEPSNNSATAKVTLSSSAISLHDGLSHQFTANVVNAKNTGLRWSVVEGGAGGSVSESGLYIAPDSAGVFHVKATSIENSLASALATVTVKKIQIIPQSSQLDVGEDTITTLSVSITGADNQEVSWQLLSEEFANRLTGNGEFTAPDVAGNYTARATSVEDSRKFADINIKVHTKSVGSSYVNWKESGILPTKLPQEAQSSIKAYGDFTGDGKFELVTSWLTYWDARFESGDKTIDEATPATLNLWRLRDDGNYEEIHGIFPLNIGCIHPRKMLVEDFNLDGMSDIFVACHGWDKSPFPGEKNVVILSANGSYILREASPDIGFFHGASSADLNSDGFSDVILTNNFDSNASISLLINNQDGSFQQTYSQIPSLLMGSGKGYFTLELIDIDSDGWLDLLVAGHEWENAPTQIFINPKTNNFSNVAPITLPTITRDQVVVDITVTKDDEVTNIWLARTTGSADSSRFYETFTIQKVAWPSLESEIVFSEDPYQWFLALFPYELEGTKYIGLDDTNYDIQIPRN